MIEIAVDYITPWIIAVMCFGGCSIAMNWITYATRWNEYNRHIRTIKDAIFQIIFTVLHTGFFCSAICLLGIVLWQW